jgi:hypothetical protein
MAPMELARIAAEAESVRLRGRARRAVGQIVAMLVGLSFLLIAIGFMHAGVWFWLREALGWTGYAASATLAAADLVIAGLLAGAASRSSPSQVERDARQIRDRAWQGIRDSMVLATFIRPAFRLLIGLIRRWRN